MKKKINKIIHSKYLLISLIVLLILLVIATGTYAWLTWKSTSNTSLTMTIGKLADVTFTSGNDISTSSLAPVFNYTDGEKTTFSISNKNTSGETLSYDVNLNITSLPSELKSSDLKYVLLKNNAKIKEGNFSTITEGINTIYSDTIATAGTTNFIFYLYIDGNNENSQNLINKTLSGTITLTGGEYVEPLSTTITNIYNNATKKDIVNNSITYKYDTTNSLMKDVGDNIRYYGTNPNNYIYFNCSDYSNQSSSTCELWRIIGVVDGKVKLMRGSNIGIYAWDNKNVSTGAETEFGRNDWTRARLMQLLNPGYESETVGGSLYYNSKSGNCYSGQNNATKVCDFTSTGIKNDTTRNMIAEANYSLLGWDLSSVYVNQIYEYERNTGSVYPGRPTSWTGKIALAYPSDYGYATNLEKCTGNLFGFDSNCTSNNWMKTIITDNSGEWGWLLSPNSNTPGNIWLVASDGYVSHAGTAYNGYVIAPVLYLKSKLGVKSGTGTSSNPYQLIVN